MGKKMNVAALLCAAVVFSVFASTNKMEKVDATTHATYRTALKMNLPITTGIDSAVVTWETYGEKAAAIRGSTTLSFAYGSSTSTLTKRATTVDERTAKKIILKGLTSNTAYQIRMDAYKAGSTEDTCIDTTTITTKPGTFATQRLNAKKDIPLELLDHSVRLGSMSKNGDHLTVADSKGRMILNHSVKGSERSIDLPPNAKGVYFLTYKRQGTILDKKQFIIIH